MPVPLLDLRAQHATIRDAVLAAMMPVVDDQAFILGKPVAELEADVAALSRTKFAVGCANGTDALWLSFLALGIGPGDECITTTNTFFATAEAIWIAGATAVFVDSDPKTNCLDPSRVEAAITPQTKALVPVHLYGQCADMKALRKIADRHGLLVVEDNAQGIGARGNGFRTGELSDAVCTSFIIQKNLGCFGDGGAVLTNHENVDRVIRKLRNHGSDKRSRHSMGYNSRLDDLQAGVLSAKLKHIDEWNALRRKWAARYSAGLRDAANIHLPYEASGNYHVYHLYVIETKKPEHRESLLDFLTANGIDAKCHYPIAIHQQEGYPWGKPARIAGPLPNSERNAACCVSLPMFPELTGEEVDGVVGKVLEWDGAAG